MNLIDHFNRYRLEIIMGLISIALIGGSIGFIAYQFYHMVYEGAI